MKRFFSHFLSAIIGAFCVIIVMIGFDRFSTVYPIYIPNIFLKEPINYSVNVNSQVIEAIDLTMDTVVQVNNYVENQLSSTGSGVIYKLSDGNAFIVTNNHVVEGASQVEIVTSKNYRVMINADEIVGTDIVTDLAVLKIAQGPITEVMEFSDSKTLKVGEQVIAIGNPLGLSGSATLGIISSKERLVPVDTNNDDEEDWYASVIQTDAPINPGNSGGALINLAGKLIGINSMKIVESNVEGIGFAIPANLVSKIVTELEIHGSVNRPTRLLGISIVSGPYNINNALKIVKVNAGSLASDIGLKVNDEIIEINGKDIHYFFDLKYVLSTAKPGENISLTIIRNNQKLKIIVPIM